MVEFWWHEILWMEFKMGVIDIQEQQEMRNWNHGDKGNLHANPQTEQKSQAWRWLRYDQGMIRPPSPTSKLSFSADLLNPCFCKTWATGSLDETTAFYAFAVEKFTQQKSMMKITAFLSDSQPVFKMPFYVTKIFGDMKGHFKNRSEVTPKRSDDTRIK